MGVRLGLLPAISAAVLCATAAAQTSVEPGPYTLSISAEPLGEALSELAQQSGLQVLFTSRLVYRLRSPRVSGSMTATEALRLLLEDTGLGFTFVNPHTITIYELSSPAPKRTETRSDRTSADTGHGATGAEDANQAGELAMSRRSSFTRFAAILGSAAASASLGGHAAAQTAPAQSNALDEVTVTATKQLESINVNKVPISISAYGQREMDTRGIRDVSDIASMTPGLHFSAQNSFGTPLSNIEIRGIQSRTSAPTTGIYLDDTPLIGRANNVNIGANGAYPQVFDLDRVEVLRGPQGTLFGASSEGGAIRFITKQPSLHESSLYARSELATTEGGDPSYEAGLAGGAPLIDGTLGFRASVWYRREGGWVDRVQPPVGKGPFTQAIDPAHPGGAVLDSRANSGSTKQARVALTWAPTDWLTVTPQLFYQNAETDDSSSYDLTFSNPGNGKFALAHSQPLPSSDPTTIPTLKIEATHGDLAITSVTANYKRNLKFKTDYTQYQDYAFFGNPWPLTGAADDYATGNYGVYQNAVSEELRLSSVDPNDRFVWVAGVFLESARQVDTVYVEHPDLPALVQNIYGQSIETILGTGPYLGKWVAYDEVHTHDRSMALFGNLDFKITPHLTATVGARWAKQESFTNLHFDGSFNGGPGFFNGRETDKPFTPKGSISWQPDDNSTYYASVAKGYRVGGVNPQTNNTQPACQAALAADGLTGKLLQTYQPDSLISYEVGAKNRFLDDRLEVQSSVFHIDWRNIQQAAQITNCGFAAVFNLGSATSQGFDVSMRAKLGQFFKIGVQLGYTDAHYESSQGNLVTKGDVIGGPAISSGTAVPPWSLSLNGQFDFTLLDRPAYVFADDTLHSKNTGPFSTHEPANIIVYDPDLVSDPATNILNLRAGMKFDRWDVSLYANNLLDEHKNLSMQHTNPGDTRFQAVTFRPRTIGLTALFRY
jgi:iron complex outermembrane recepter protein